MGSLQEFFYWILLKFLLVFFQRFLQHSFMDPSGGSFRNFSRDFSRGPPIASSWYSLNDLSQDSIRDILKLPPGFPSWVSRRNTSLIVLGYFREFFRCFSRISSTIFPGFYFGIFQGFFYWSFPRSQVSLKNFYCDSFRDSFRIFFLEFRWELLPTFLDAPRSTRGCI